MPRMASTIVLARKYRPRRFEDMVGQDTAVKALSNALRSQRLHHAYLFTGTRGIGKTTVSRIFAKCLNCTGADGQGGVTAQPCGSCDACVQIDEDRFIDYLELDAASNRGIAEVRELLERAAYKPSVGRYKVFMIDEAHQLTKESFNALLKTLEEPPEYVKFILATTDPQKMPATVLSRCLQFNLRPMAPVTLREHLARVLDAEGIAHEPAALDVLARAAQGSMRDALSLADQAIAFGGGSLAADAVRTMLGAVGNDIALALIDALARRSGREIVDGVARLREQGASAEGALEAMAVLLQDIAIEQAAPGSIDPSMPDAAQVQRLAQAMPADDTQLLYSIVLHGRPELGLAPDAYAGMTMVLLRMLAFPAAGGAASGEKVPTAPARAAVSGGGGAGMVGSAGGSSGGDNRAAALLDNRAAAPLVAARGSDSRSGDTASLVPHDAGTAHADPRLADRWAAVVAELQARQLVGAMVRELALQSSLVALDEAATPPTWRLVVEREALRAQALQDKLAGALEQHLGAPLRLLLDAGRAVDTPAQRDAAERERRQREAERIVREDPLVQAMLATYKTARIVPGSIQITQELKP
jgi:DNA polymerase III subunit gamma/tau